MVWPIQQQHPGSHMVPHQNFFSGGFPQQQASGGLQKLLSPQGAQSLLPERIGGLTQKLGNVQQVLNVVQQATPIVQQYGPMVKNLPTLLKLMKAFNEDDSDDSDDAEEAIDDKSLESSEESDIPESHSEENDAGKTDPPDTKVTARTGKSTPKLFI